MKKHSASAGKKQRMLFQQIQVASDDEQEKELGKIDGFVNTAYMSNKNHKNLSDFGVNQPFQLLQAHGITMIPVENDSIVENAMESGRTVVLTGNFFILFDTLQNMIFHIIQFCSFLFHRGWKTCSEFNKDQCEKNPGTKL